GDMVKVSDNEYDNGQVGDGNLTTVTLHPGGTKADRVTQMHYDWRNRLVATKAGVGDAGTGEPITFLIYDDLDRVTRRDIYEGTGVTITSSDGVPQAPLANLLRARTAMEYDHLGRMYR